MDYKKIIKSRSVRLKILTALSFVPDKFMLKVQYRIKMGHKLNLKNPRRFTEKLQWYKLFYKDPQMIQCVDKYDVREYVRNKGLEEILIPCYGVYEAFNEIDWSRLKEKFVIKDTLGGGGNSVIIVNNKQDMDLKIIEKEINSWVKNKAHIRNGGREWPYYSGKNHRIIIEDYISAENDASGLIDYKFLCFSGEPKILYVTAGRNRGNKVELGIYDEKFNQLNAYVTYDNPLKNHIEKPDNFDEMKNIARMLSEDFPHARIDLYNNKGKIMFGEITFYDGSGYTTYEPDEFDYTIGEYFSGI